MNNKNNMLSSSSSSSSKAAIANPRAANTNNDEARENMVFPVFRAVPLANVGPEARRVLLVDEQNQQVMPAAKINVDIIAMLNASEDLSRGYAEETRLAREETRALLQASEERTRVAEENARASAEEARLAREEARASAEEARLAREEARVAREAAQAAENRTAQVLEELAKTQRDLDATKDRVTELEKQGGYQFRHIQRTRQDMGLSKGCAICGTTKEDLYIIFCGHVRCKSCINIHCENSCASCKGHVRNPNTHSPPYRLPQQQQTTSSTTDGSVRDVLRELKF